MFDLEKQDLKNKKVIVRVDLNVPIDDNDNVTDTTRIVACKETVDLILEKGGTCILISHLGRPKGKENKFSLKKIVDTVSSVLNQPVFFYEDCIGQGAQEAISKLDQGSIILMENLRFYEEETLGDRGFAKKLSELGDIYVNDAFGTCHREHASTAVIAEYFKNKKFAGKLLQKELEAINQIANNGKKPVLAILGGAKVSSKLSILYNLIKNVDKIIIGGGMAYTFIKAKGGQIGNSLVEDELITNAQEILSLAQKLDKKIILPVDTKASKDFDNNNQISIFNSKEIEDGWMGLDIGTKSMEIFNQEILTSNTIFWNGPMGVFEFPKYAKGTIEIGESIALATKSGSFSLVGGGDSVAAVKQFGLENKMSYISTGGGAMLESLEGKKLPGIAALS